MTLINNFRDKLDLIDWRMLTTNTNANFGAGNAMTYDKRNVMKEQNPNIWLMQALTGFMRYTTVNDAWLEMTAFQTLSGVIAAGSTCVYCPSQGPAGTIGGTPTTTSFTLAALPNSASALTNQLANAGAGVMNMGSSGSTSQVVGYKIRVKGNGTGSSGKINERFIIANTSGTTPTITLNSALDWTPATTDTYEILSGCIYMVGAGSTASGFFNSMDVATMTAASSGSLSVTNLSAGIGIDTATEMLDELYVPYNRRPGEGFLGSTTYDPNNPDAPMQAIQATASAAGTITGQASGGDATVLLNQYANYQIRIVQDLVNTTAVGQRLRITSHTAGPSPVYTMTTNWSVQPSSSALFVIEQNNDLLLWTNGQAVTYSYAAGGFQSTASWSTAAVAGGAAQYPNPATAMGAGCCAECAFSIVPDSNANARQSYVYWLRAGATSTMAYLDIAALAWTTITPPGMTAVALTTGTCSATDPAGNQGRYMYVVINVTDRFMRFDMLNQIWEPWFAAVALGGGVGGTAVVGAKLATSVYSDSSVNGANKLVQLYLMGNTSEQLYSCLLQR